MIKIPDRKILKNHQEFHSFIPQCLRTGPDLKKTLASKAYGTDNIGPLKFS